MNNPIESPKQETNVDEFLQKEPDEVSTDDLAKISGGMRVQKATLDPTETSGCCGG
jgi:hypothetical protein